MYACSEKEREIEQERNRALTCSHAPEQTSWMFSDAFVLSSMLQRRCQTLHNKRRPINDSEHNTNNVLAANLATMSIRIAGSLAGRSLDKFR